MTLVLMCLVVKATEINVLCDKPFLLNNFGTQIYLPSLVETKNGYKAIASGFNIYLADHNVVSNSYYVKLYSSLTNS